MLRCRGLAFLLVVSLGGSVSAETQDELRQALRKASAFMMETVAYRDGFLMLYSEDLTRQWGELPARRTMIWVQDPATVGVGETLLRAYRVTGNPDYLGWSRRVASALIQGQHPSGGWHYFIDFEPEKTEEWYREVGSRCWGWEEFYHDYGNATFDDNVTVGASRFLLQLFLETGDREIRKALDRSLQFILDAQYPNGAWPQRYPLDPGQLLDKEIGYTAYYTFNDDVILGNIRYLLEAARELGNESYREAAIRGMDFVLLAQLPEPQAGWAQQYDLNLEPAAARSYEPAALSTIDTYHNILALGDFYLETGDRKYLQAISPAIRWLDASTIPKDHSPEGHSHATFIEIGTDRPIYGHREGTSIENGRYWNDHNPENLLRGYGYTFDLDTSALWKRYRRLAEEELSKLQKEYRNKREPEPATPPSPSRVRRILDEMDARGAWVEDLTFPDTRDYMHNPPEKFRGIATKTFLANTDTLLDAIEAENRTQKDRK